MPYNMTLTRARQQRDGLSHEALRQADHVVTIKQTGVARSLNVAQAAGIACYGIANPPRQVNPMEIPGDAWQSSAESEVALLQRHFALTRVRGRASGTDHMTNIADWYRGHSVAELRERLDVSESPALRLFLWHPFADRNLGGLVRTAAAFRLPWVSYAGKRKFDRRAATGLHNVVPLLHMGDEHEAAKALRFLQASRRVRIIGLAQAGDVSLAHAVPLEYACSRWVSDDTCGGVCLVLASEGGVIPEPLRNILDEIIMLPNSRCSLPSSIVAAVASWAVDQARDQVRRQG